MRDHRQIIAAVGSVEKIAESCSVSIHTARSWSRRGKIPDDQWMTFARRGWATLEELAAAVDRQGCPAAA